MFELAVLGPIVTRGLGVARQCMTCRRARLPEGVKTCFGFGPGCMEYRPKAGDRRAGEQARAGDAAA